ncbi:MAG TPA: FlgD immunoglobulin-like domain containing protein [Candidatus Eisenbacteria bacterium]
MRTVALTIVGMTLATRLVAADPELTVSYAAGAPRVAISGSYPQAHYTVWRRLPSDASWRIITDGDVLCLGPCYALDVTAGPGRTYLYRFDLTLADGSIVSFGPYPVSIPPGLDRAVRAAAWPNPTRGGATIELFVGGAGAPVEAEVRVFDAQGRMVATLHRGPVARGLTAIAWDGHGGDGGPLAAGIYLLRVSTPLGGAVARIARAR